MKINKFSNSVDPDEAAHNEPSHLDLHCLPSSLEFSIYKLGRNTLKFSRLNIGVWFLTFEG